MPLYGHITMQHLPVSLRPANGWACVMEVDREAIGAQADAHVPMSESDVRELIEALEDALR